MPVISPSERYQIYKDAYENFREWKQAYFFAGLCHYFLKVHTIDVYDWFKFKETFPELFSYRTNYKGDRAFIAMKTGEITDEEDSYLWTTDPKEFVEQRLLALDRAMKQVLSQL